MENYAELLEKAYKNIKAPQTSGERFEMPKVQGQVSGKNTIITNIAAIASYIRRPAISILEKMQIVIKPVFLQAVLQFNLLHLKTQLRLQDLQEVQNTRAHFQIQKTQDKKKITVQMQVAK
jgi:translation initiation factor 2 beta subunit (eIF-2beta)/eIF-5